MLYRFLADVVLLLHFSFVVFVALGGLLVLRWSTVAWIHVPAVLWGVFIEYAGATCPLTPLEIAWRERGGEAGYSGGFLDHYLTMLLYPTGLTRGSQIVLGSLVLAINVVVYSAFIVRRRNE